MFKQLFIFSFIGGMHYVAKSVSKVFGVIYQIDVKISSVLYHVTMHLGDWGKSLNQFISLVALPFALAGGVILLLDVSHTTMPNVMTVVWVTWHYMGDPIFL